jgi:hypothetical protein
VGTSKKIGFARLSPEERAELGSRGGKQAHVSGRAHTFDRKEAVAAARKRRRRNKRGKKAA